jgi:microcompartment protein CcmK/EutM
MLMAKVVGSVVSTQKDETLVGKKLMIISEGVENSFLAEDPLVNKT